MLARFLGFCLVLAPLLSGAADWSQLPSPAPLVDEVGVLRPDEKQQLELILREIKGRGGVEISVYIAGSLQEMPIEDFSLAVAERWGLGTKKEDKGLLFVVAPREKKMRFEVGYGLEGEVTDAFSRRVLDNYVRPYFREGKYYEGIRAGIGGLQEKIPLGVDNIAPRRNGIRLSPLLFVVLVIFAAFVVFAQAATGLTPRRRYGGSWGGGGFGGGSGWGGGGSGGFGSWGGGGGGFGGGGSSSSW